MNMKKRLVEVTVMFAEDLKNINFIHRLDPYVSVSLTGCGKQDTKVHENGGTSPHWEELFTFTVDEDTAHAGLLSLRFNIMTKKTVGGDKEIGMVEMSVEELLEQQVGGIPKAMSRPVRLPSGKTQGLLKFFYKFGEPFDVPPYPPPAGYGHLPNAAPAYSYPPQGFGALPQGYYQEPPKKSHGLGVVQGLVMGNAIENTISGVLNL